MGSGERGACADVCTQLLPACVEALVWSGLPQDTVLSVYRTLLSARATHDVAPHGNTASTTLNSQSRDASRDVFEPGHDALQRQSRGSLGDVIQHGNDATRDFSSPISHHCSGSDATHRESQGQAKNSNITAAVLFQAVELAMRSNVRNDAALSGRVSDVEESVSEGQGHYAPDDPQDDGDWKLEEQTGSPTDSASVQQQQEGQQAVGQGGHSARRQHLAVSTSTTTTTTSSQQATAQQHAATMSTQPPRAAGFVSATEGATSAPQQPQVSAAPSALHAATVASCDTTDQFQPPLPPATENMREMTAETNLESVSTEPATQTVASSTTVLPNGSVSDVSFSAIQQPPTSTSLSPSPATAATECPPVTHAAAVETNSVAAIPTPNITMESPFLATDTGRETNPTDEKSRERIRQLQKLRALRAENRRLKARQTCRHCHVRPVSLTLLPCGHFCLCEECGATFTACPVCRKTILADVRTFVS